MFEWMKYMLYLKNPKSIFLVYSCIWLCMQDFLWQRNACPDPIRTGHTFDLPGHTPRIACTSCGQGN
jgi:hypothetical protein